MLRSACGVSVSVSVPLLLPGVGSVAPVGGDTVAVLLRLPVAVGSIVPLRVRVMLWPLARFSPLQTPVLLLYVPVLGVKLGFRIVAGTLSVTVTLLSVLGPLFITVMV